MILGLGTDLCDIGRIAESLKRFPGRFENRLYTEQEQARAERRPFNREGRYAQMFAAKEACSKALGTGFRKGVSFRPSRNRTNPGSPNQKQSRRPSVNDLFRLWTRAYPRARRCRQR